MEKFLDHQFRSGSTESPQFHELVNREPRPISVFCNNHTLARSQPIGLDDDGIMGFFQNSIGLPRRRTLPEIRSRNVVRLNKLLCEAFAGFQPRLISGRADRNQIILPKDINHTFA